MTSMSYLFCTIILISLGWPLRLMAYQASPDEQVTDVLQRSLERCFSESGGVRKITWNSPLPEDIRKIQQLGDAAVPELGRAADSPNDFVQLFAVKFLLIIGSAKTLEPLEKALSLGHWEVTRAQALAGLFVLSKDVAKPYVTRSLQDPSALVRGRAEELIRSYPQLPKPH